VSFEYLLHFHVRLQFLFVSRFCLCSPGEVFVHRNIGNQVPGNDLNVLSVLEFAVGHLHIKDIIVTGKHPQSYDSLFLQNSLSLSSE
jgi:hypothetical protein